MSKKAVVIDDEVDLTSYLSAILEEHGFEVRSANDARTGEDLILEETPDVILLDLMMPGRTGIQLFTRLRGNDATREIPLVMVTGIKEQTGIDWGDIVDRYRVRQPDGFIEKPIEPERLMSVIDEILSGKAKDGGVVHG